MPLASSTIFVENGSERDAVLAILCAIRFLPASLCQAFVIALVEVSRALHSSHLFFLGNLGEELSAGVVLNLSCFAHLLSQVSVQFGVHFCQICRLLLPLEVHIFNLFCILFAAGVQFRSLEADLFRSVFRIYILDLNVGPSGRPL